MLGELKSLLNAVEADFRRGGGTGGGGGGGSEEDDKDEDEDDGDAVDFKLSGRQSSLLLFILPVESVTFEPNAGLELCD